MRRTVLFLKRCEGYRVGGEGRIARRAQMIRFSVKYYDGLAFKSFTIQTRYTESSLEKNM